MTSVPARSAVGAAAGSIPRLIRLTRSRDPDVQWQAAEALGRVGRRAVPALVQALVHPSPATRIGVVEALGVIRDPGTVDPVIRLLGADPCAEVRWTAAVVLGLLGDDRAGPSLVAALRDGSRYVRLGAADALRRLGRIPADGEEAAWFAAATQDWDTLARCGSRAVAPLLLALSDADPALRRAAVAICSRIDDPGIQTACGIAAMDERAEVRWTAVTVASACSIPPVRLPRWLVNRKRRGRTPWVVALLNLLFPGIGYNYLGKWWGFLLFQLNVTLVLTFSLWMGPLLPQAASTGAATVFAVHSYLLAGRMLEED
ncbi:MAG: HEAT repeat domain-containing protein [Methanomicrobiales archaeon]|nr:HEAT repeat domain-containing protein [Methanomicrobiales archaeon]